MRRSRIIFFPLPRRFILILFVLIGLLIVFIEFDIIQYAYEKIGIDRRYVFALLLLSLLGSYVNIPLGELPEARVFTEQTISFFGMRYVIPALHEQPKTVVAINLGGAVILVLLSAYLVFKHDLFGRTLLAVAVVTLVVHSMARPLKGVGIAVPMFIPPVVVAGTFDGIFLAGIIAVLLT